METTVLSAFSNKVRLQLLICLSKGNKNVTQLIGNCGLSQSAVSQHLEKLRSAGIVNTKRDGKEIIYSLTYPKAAKISTDLMNFTKEVTT
jgi:ArsR family transcriptional regulator